MGAAISQAELEAVSTWPPPPFVLDLTKPELQDPTKEFAHALETFNRESIAWDARMKVNIERLGALVDKTIKGGDAETIDYLRDVVIAGFITLVDAYSAHIKRTMETTVERFETKISATRDMSPQIWRLLSRQVKRYVDAMSRQHDRTVDVYYGLLALRADCDLDAHNGPSFNSGEEIEEYLRSQIVE